MPNVDISDRERYVQSGKIRPRFILLAAATLLLAEGLGVALYLCYRFDFYLIIFLPLIAAACLVPAIMASIRAGHCRSRLLGIGLGLLAGTVLYFGNYHAGLVDSLGLRDVHRVDLLPWYIEWRIANDVPSEVNRWNVKERSPSPGLNIFGTVLEFCGILAITAFAGIAASRKTYCEACGRWMKREAVFFPFGSSPILLRALRARDFSEVERLERAEHSVGERAYTALILDRCPHSRAPGDPCRWYLTISEIRCGAGMEEGTFDIAFGPSPAARVVVSPEEVEELAAVFTSLRPAVRKGISSADPVKVA